MIGLAQLRIDLSASMAGADSPLEAADRLCQACVRLFDVDGAAVSVLHGGTTQGTFGSSGTLSRRLDELQFTFGEGPCLDAVATGRPVLAEDLTTPTESRWPAFTPAVLGSGVAAVFALPVPVARSFVGALDLFRNNSGPLSPEVLRGSQLAAEFAAVPLLDLMSAPVDWSGIADSGDGWDQLSSLERVEVYQATGMIMAALDVGPAEALVRLRAHAFTHAMTASEVGWAIVERRLVLDRDDGWERPIRPGRDASSGPPRPVKGPE